MDIQSAPQKSDPAQLWREAVRGIDTVTQGRIRHYLEELQWRECDRGRMTIKVNGSAQDRNWINDRLRENFERELWRLTQQMYTVYFTMDIENVQLLPNFSRGPIRRIVWPADSQIPVVAGDWTFLPDGRIRAGYDREELERALSHPSLVRRIDLAAILAEVFAPALGRLGAE